MRRALCVGAVVLGLVGAGCGDSDSGSGGGEKASGPTPSEAAEKFIGCFKKPGYQAVHPKEQEQSLFALKVKKVGYDAVPVNVTQRGVTIGSVYLVFFKDEATAKKALDEEGVVAEGDAPPLQRGQAIAGYLDESSKKDLEPAVTACL